MLQRSLKPLLASLLLTATFSPLFAQMAQEPLLNRPNPCHQI